MKCMSNAQDDVECEPQRVGFATRAAMPKIISLDDSSISNDSVAYRALLPARSAFDLAA